VTTEADPTKKLSIFFLLAAAIVYGLWSCVGLFLPEFYYDRPIERLLLAVIGFLFAIYLISSHALEASKSTLLVSLYALILHFHFLSLFARAGGDEIYALGILIFLVGSSLLFSELLVYIGFFTVVILSYLPVFFALNLPSYRIVMLVAGILTIGAVTSLLLFLRIRLSNQFHAQRLTTVRLERRLVEEELEQKKEESQRYKTVAYYDFLTGLPNRTFLHDYLQRIFDLAYRTQKPFALLFADLDGFKEINDTYGHDAGDTVLCYFAERFKTNLRSGDFHARYAGDEFVAILPEIAAIADAGPICERIIKIAADPYPLQPDITCTIGVSIGVAFYPGRVAATRPPIISCPQDLIKYADSAMYEAKRRGKNIWMPYSEKLAFLQALNGPVS